MSSVLNDLISPSIDLFKEPTEDVITSRSKESSLDSKSLRAELKSKSLWPELARAEIVLGRETLAKFLHQDK